MFINRSNCVVIIELQMDTQTLIWDHQAKTLPLIFSKDDIDRMYEALDNYKYKNNQYGLWTKARNKALFTLMYHTAGRPREICSLKFSDFDLEKRTIRIDGSNNKIKRDRVIPLPEKALYDLSIFLSFPRFLWRGSLYLFPSNESQCISPSTWKTIMREHILKPAGLYIQPDIPQHSKRRSYTLRHTKLSEVWKKSHNIFDVANLAGHSKLESSKVYIHTDDTYMNHLRSLM